MTIRQPDGEENAIAQFWSHNLTDTSLRPYNAMFNHRRCRLRRSLPAYQGASRPDENGASERAADACDGCFDPANRVYENKACLYFARLLDSTRGGDRGGA
jgi:hypothetical protein